MAREFRIGDAIIRFRADVAKYVSNLTRADRALQRKRRALNAARRDFRSFGRRVDSTARSLVSLRSAFLLAAGGGGIGLLIARSSQLGASLTEMSVRTGLSVDALQTLGRTFEGDGLSTEKFQRSIFRLHRGMAEAREGIAEYKDAFDALDIDVSTLNSAEDAIYAISDALQAGRVDQVDAIGALQDIFGRAGPLAFNVLRRGSEAIREQQQEFRNLGIVTTEQAAILKALDQTQINLVNSVSANAARVTAELAGAIGGGLERVIGAIPHIFDRLQQVAQFALEHIEALSHALIVLGGVIIRRTFVGRFVGNLGRAVIALLDVRLAVSSTTQSLLFFWRASGRAAIGIRSAFAATRSAITGVAAAVSAFSITSQITGIHTALAGAASSLQAFGTHAVASFNRANAAAVATSGAMVGLNGTLKALALTLRVGVTVSATAAAVAFTTLSRVVASTVGFMRRLIFPLILIEGIIRAIQFFAALRDQVRNLHVDFGEAAAVAAAQFVGFFAETLSKLPEVVLRVMHAAVAAASEFLIASGRQLGTGLLNLIERAIYGEQTLAEATEREYRAIVDSFTRGGPQTARANNELQRLIRVLTLVGAVAEDTDLGSVSARIAFAATEAGEIALRNIAEAEARLTGGVIAASESTFRDAFINAARAGAEAFGDAPLTALIEGTGIADTLIAATGLSPDKVNEAKGAIDRALVEVQGSFAAFANSVRGEAGALGDEIDAAVIPDVDMAAVVAEAEALGQAISDSLASPAITDSVRLYDDLVDSIQRADRATRDQAVAVGVQGEALAVLQARQRLATQIAEAEAEARGRVVAAAEALIRAEQELAVATQSADGRRRASARTQLEAAEENLRVAREISDETDRQIIQALGLIDVVEEQARAQYRAAEATREANESFQSLQSTIRTIEGSFGSFVSDTITGFKSIGDAARQLANTIIRSLAQSFIADPITKAIGGLFGGGGIGSLFGFQDGGFANPGFAVVGEAGPEIVDFRRPARIYSNEDLGAALSGGGGAVVNLTINADTPSAFERALADYLPAISDAVEGAIARDASRPSAFSSSLGRR